MPRALQDGSEPTRRSTGAPLFESSPGLCRLYHSLNGRNGFAPFRLVVGKTADVEEARDCFALQQEGTMQSVKDLSPAEFRRSYPDTCFTCNCRIKAYLYE